MQQAILPYPSVQNIHTVPNDSMIASQGQRMNGMNEQALAAGEGGNLYNRAPLSRTPMFVANPNFEDDSSLQRASSGQDKGSLVAGQQPDSHRESPLKARSPLLPHTNSTITQNTEQANLSQPQVMHTREHQAHHNDHQGHINSYFGAANGLPDGRNTSYNEMGERDPDDLPEAMDDDLDNSLLKSELLERNDGQTSMDEATGQSANLQDKLSQVKNVFTAIRQNLNEGSTDAREPSSNQSP